MSTTYVLSAPPGFTAAPDPIRDLGHIFPLHPDFERNPRPPLLQRHPPKKQPPEKNPRKPDDPEHKVDEYA